MIIYKDILTGDEMFSDAHNFKEYKGFYYVQGKMKTETSGDIDESMIGGNKSAEEPAEESCDVTSTTACDLVLESRLNQVPPYSFKDFQTYIKKYAKKVLAKLEEDPVGNAEALKTIKDDFKEGVKYLKPKLAKEDIEFFTGETNDVEGGMGYLDFEEDGITPYMLFFKSGLRGEKV